MHKWIKIGAQLSQKEKDAITYRGRSCCEDKQDRSVLSMLQLEDWRLYLRLNIFIQFITND